MRHVVFQHTYQTFSSFEKFIPLFIGHRADTIGPAKYSINTPFITDLQNSCEYLPIAMHMADAERVTEMH